MSFQFTAAQISWIEAQRARGPISQPDAPGTAANFSHVYRQVVRKR